MKVLSMTVIVLMSMHFSGCSSAQKLQKEVPFAFDNVYYQSWVAGVKGGGSGINLFIPLAERLPQSITLDSVYFRGRVAKLETKPNNPKLYIGRFQTEANQQKDIIMSSDPTAEYGNQLPIKLEKIPFELEDNACVISYLDNKTVKYFKIDSITQKATEHYPSAPPKRN